MGGWHGNKQKALIRKDDGNLKVLGETKKNFLAETCFTMPSYT